MNKTKQSVGRVSDSVTRQLANADIFGDVGLRDETANPTYGTTSEAFRKIIERDKVVVQQQTSVSGWAEQSVSDIAEITPGRSLKKGMVSPFIEMAALSADSRDIPLSQIATRPFSGSGSRFMDGDVLLARITPCLENGKTVLVSGLGKAVVGHGSTEFIVLAAKNVSEQRFVYYLARHPDFRDYAIQHMEGTSGRQRVSAGAIGKYRFLCPPPHQREEIGEVLGILDDKITLLRETNATLEAIAQALFKSWLVNFDPVRAKAEGLEPEGIPPEIAVLFPSEFEDSELGEIPRGWRALPLADACEINPTRRLTKGKITPYLEMSALPTQGHRTDKPTPRAFSSGTKFINGDTLLARITPCLENGKTAFVDCLFEDEVGWGSTEYIVLRTKAPLPSYWAYLLSRHEHFRQYAIQAMVGTSGRQRVEVSRLSQYLVAVPNERISVAFAELVEPLQRSIAANDDAAKSLAALRDTLLPRLMSGKLRLPEAEVLLEDVT